MNRSIRFWLEDAEEMFGMSAAGALAIAAVHFVLNGSADVFRAAGVLLAIISGMLIFIMNIQNVHFLSISIMLGNTRKCSLFGMHMMNLLVFIQIEILQLLLYFMPFINQQLQLIVLEYTPVLFMALSGASYLLSFIQTISEKLYKILFTVSCFGMGGFIGFLGSFTVSIVMEDIPEVLSMGGLVFIILLIVSAALYAVGSYVHARSIRNLDVRV